MQGIIRKKYNLFFKINAKNFFIVVKLNIFKNIKKINDENKNKKSIFLSNKLLKINKTAPPANIEDNLHP
ncbi:hypothetical protein, partial [Acinetobacter chenhuanii]|uniref:hypothetical protein n=1 Tax=Acinetobacter sp. XH1741 TaxID=3157354 RepID=UPI0032B4E12C